MLTYLVHTVPLNILGIAEAAVTIIAASIPVLRALLATENPTKVGTSKLITTPVTASSQAWRDYESLGDVLSKEPDLRGPVDFITFEEYAGSSPQKAPPPQEAPPWARGW